MKESWLYYDYLRRWLLLLLAGPAFGAVLGFTYYSNSHHPPQFAAAATVAIKDATWHSLLSVDYLPYTQIENTDSLKYYGAPEVEVVINSGVEASERAAVESIMSTIIQLADHVEGVMEFREPSITRVPESGDVFWKPVVMGAVLATLLIMGCIYVWEDALAYRRHLPTAELTNL